MYDPAEHVEAESFRLAANILNLGRWEVEKFTAREIQQKVPHNVCGGIALQKTSL